MSGIALRSLIQAGAPALQLRKGQGLCLQLLSGTPAQTHLGQLSVGAPYYITEEERQKEGLPEF